MHELVPPRLRVLPTFVKGMFDYILGIAMIVWPVLFGPTVERRSAELWCGVISGVVIVMLALFTDYEFGVVRRISPAVHNMVEIGIGAFLLMSPVFLSLPSRSWTAFVGLGICSLLLGVFSENEPLTLERRTR